VGSKLEFFAVDMRPLEEFVDRSLGDALLYFSEHTGEERSPWFDLESGWYEWVPQARMRKRVRGPRGLRKAWTPLSAADIDVDPDLAILYRDYVKQQEAISLMFLLRALAACPTAPWVQELSKGYRGWWIWSLLDWVERSQLLQPAEYTRYE
jgi:hypothetical protein